MSLINEFIIGGVVGIRKPSPEQCVILIHSRT